MFNSIWNTLGYATPAETNGTDSVSNEEKEKQREEKERDIRERRLRTLTARIEAQTQVCCVEYCTYISFIAFH